MATERKSIVRYYGFWFLVAGVSAFALGFLYPDTRRLLFAVGQFQIIGGFLALWWQRKTERENAGD